MSVDRLRIFFDGGCRPNPGTMEIAAVARGKAYVERDAGPGSSHQAEWLALLHAVRLATELGGADVELIGDSIAIIGVASGKAKARATDVPHLVEYRAAITAIPKLRLRHIARSKNLAGIALAKVHPR